MARSQTSLPRGVLLLAFGALLALPGAPATEAATATVRLAGRRYLFKRSPIKRSSKRAVGSLNFEGKFKKKKKLVAVFSLLRATVK